MFVKTIIIKMANWCSNNLIVKGTKEDREKLFRYFVALNKEYEKTGEGVAFSDIIFEDIVFDDADKDDYVENSNDDDDFDYEDLLVPYNERFDEDDESETYLFEIDIEKDNFINFRTKWMPPKNGLLKLSRKFPNVKFGLTYSELNNGIFGKLLILNGELI